MDQQQHAQQLGGAGPASAAAQAATAAQAAAAAAVRDNPSCSGAAGCIDRGVAGSPQRLAGAAASPSAAAAAARDAAAAGSPPPAAPANGDSTQPAGCTSSSCGGDDDTAPATLAPSPLQSCDPSHACSPNCCGADDDGCCCCCSSSNSSSSSSSSAGSSSSSSSSSADSVTAAANSEPGCSVFFAWVPPTVPYSSILSCFEQYGNVKSLNLFRPWATAKTSKGCGTVEFESPSMAAAAMDALHQKYKWPGGGTCMVVEWLDPNRVRNGRSGTAQTDASSTSSSPVPASKTRPSGAHTNKTAADPGTRKAHKNRRTSARQGSPLSDASRAAGVAGFAAGAAGGAGSCQAWLPLPLPLPLHQAAAASHYSNAAAAAAAAAAACMGALYPGWVAPLTGISPDSAAMLQAAAGMCVGSVGCDALAAELASCGSPLPTHVLPRIRTRLGPVARAASGPFSAYRHLSSSGGWLAAQPPVVLPGAAAAAAAVVAAAQQQPGSPMSGYEVSSFGVATPPATANSGCYLGCDFQALLAPGRPNSAPLFSSQVHELRSSSSNSSSASSGCLPQLLAGSQLMTEEGSFPLAGLAGAAAVAAASDAAAGLFGSGAGGVAALCGHAGSFGEPRCMSAGAGAAGEHHHHYHQSHQQIMFTDWLSALAVGGTADGGGIDHGSITGAGAGAGAASGGLFVDHYHHHQAAAAATANYAAAGTSAGGAGLSGAAMSLHQQLHHAASAAAWYGCGCDAHELAGGAPGGLCGAVGELLHHPGTPLCAELLSAGRAAIAVQPPAALSVPGAGHMWL